MRLDASIECGTDEHGSVTELAFGLIALWPAGSLILFISLLVACYKPLQAKRPNALTRATTFLHREYKATFYWWEAVELARKLVLTGFVLLIPEERAFVRLVVATLICSFYAVVLAVVRPFKRVEDNVLAVATSLVLLLLFLATNWTTIFLVERTSVDDADAVLGFDNRSSIINSMLVLVGATLVFFLIGAVCSARLAKEVPKIRLVSTNQPPEMSVGMGILFNSHIWSTGQDAVAVIKKQEERRGRCSRASPCPRSASTVWRTRRRACTPATGRAHSDEPATALRHTRHTLKPRHCRWAGAPRLAAHLAAARRGGGRRGGRGALVLPAAATRRVRPHLDLRHNLRRRCGAALVTPHRVAASPPGGPRARRGEELLFRRRWLGGGVPNARRGGRPFLVHEREGG